MSNLPDLLWKYCDQEQMHSFEMGSGVKNLEKIVAVLGYDNKFGGHLANFFADNSGAIEAVIEWIGNQESPEWIEAIENELQEEKVDRVIIEAMKLEDDEDA